jgi:hypothetical protein
MERGANNYQLAITANDVKRVTDFFSILIKIDQRLKLERKQNDRHYKNSSGQNDVLDK